MRSICHNRSTRTPAPTGCTGATRSTATRRSCAPSRPTPASGRTITSTAPSGWTSQQKSPGAGPGLLVCRKQRRSGAVVHIELDRARRGLPPHYLFPLDLAVGVDLVLGEHVALEQELVVGLERFQRLAQAAAHSRHLGQLGGRQVVEVLV